MQQSGGLIHTQPHEHLLQLLNVITAQLNAIHTQLRDDSVSVDRKLIGDRLAFVEQLAQDAIYEIRAAEDDGAMVELLGVSLVEALSRLVEETAEAGGLASRVSITGDERPLASPVERLLYRITQEALFQVRQHSQARKLRFSFHYGRDDVQLSVEDDGILLNSEEEVPFAYFKNESQAAVGIDSSPFNALRHRLEHLGGTLEINTLLEQGSRVQVRLPYIAPVEQHELLPQLHLVDTENQSAEHDVSAPATVRLLLVDNQAVSRAGLRRLLESYRDLQVIGEAADGVQAVSETLELGPQVVLMDAHLPNGQSMQALRQIKQLNLNTRVLLFSAEDREEYLYETLRAGADGYVLKDIVPDELAEAVRAVARGEVLVQPQLAGRLLSRFGKQGRGSTLYEALTAREQEVLKLLARGLRNKEIAARLFVSERTVNFHLANIYQKLNVSGRTEALSKALEQGLITA